MNAVREAGQIYVVYELCSDEERISRKDSIAASLLKTAQRPEIRDQKLPGISFWNNSMSN
jgi:hypothetical protein